MIDWAGYMTLILEGAWVTIQLTVLGCVVALIVAFVMGLGRLSRFWFLRAGGDDTDRTPPLLRVVARV